MAEISSFVRRISPCVREWISPHSTGLILVRFSDAESKQNFLHHRLQTPHRKLGCFSMRIWGFCTKIRALLKKTNNVKKNKHIITNTLMIYTTWKSFQNFLSTLFLRFFFVKKIPQLSSVFSLSFFTYAFLAFFQPYREAYGKNEKMPYLEHA